MPTFYRFNSGESTPEAVPYTDELWAVASNQAALTYLDEQSDVKQDAVAKTLARGITPDNPNYDVTLANYGKEHWIRYGKNENRQGVGASVLRTNPGFSDLGQANAVGATPNLVFQGSTAGDFVNTVPRTGSDQPTTIIPNPDPTGGGDAGGGDAGGGDAGGDAGGGDFGPIPIIPADIDFSPVTNLIGTDSGPNRDTIMGRQKIAQDFLEGTIKSGQEGLAAGQADLTKNQLGLMTRIGQPGTDDVLPTGLYKGQQGIRDVVDPLASQVTGLDTKVTGVSDQIGTQAVGDTPATGLFAGQAGLAGQISDVGDTATAVQGLVGAPTEGGPQTLFESQQQLGQRIGTPSEGQTDLFTGQAGLMRGQQNLTTDIGAVSTDLSKEAANIQNQIRGFEQAAQEYQAGATAKRGDIANTAIANQQALMGQIGGVGQTMNQQSEALAKQRQAEAAQFNAAQAPLQQQIANLTSNNQALQSNLQNIGPMGPMAADPRDALIQQLLTRNAALMNNRPV